jgi:hypothetical protein
MLEKNPKNRPTAYQCLKLLYESKKIDLFTPLNQKFDYKLID